MASSWQSPTPRGWLRFEAMARQMSTNQFKNGTHIEVDGSIYAASLEFQHVKPGKGGAFVRTRLRKLDDGTVDKTFRAGEKFRPVRTETRRMQYLYGSGDDHVFMDNQSYDQLGCRTRSRATRCGGCSRTTRSCSSKRAPVGRPGGKRRRECWCRRLGGVKGDTASGGGTKPATLESGVVVDVPLFVNQGDPFASTPLGRVRLAGLKHATLRSAARGRVRAVPARDHRPSA